MARISGNDVYLDPVDIVQDDIDSAIQWNRVLERKYETEAAGRQTREEDKYMAHHGERSFVLWAGYPEWVRDNEGGFNKPDALGYSIKTGSGEGYGLQFNPNKIMRAPHFLAVRVEEMHYRMIGSLSYKRIQEIHKSHRLQRLFTGSYVIPAELLVPADDVCYYVRELALQERKRLGYIA